MNAFIYKPLFKCSLAFNNAKDKIFRDKYIYRRELVGPSCLILYRNKKKTKTKSYVDWKTVLLEKFS